MRQRQPEQLGGWLERAAQSALKAFERFAGGLREDYEAVKAAMTLPWSTALVEGQTNRLKMLKRQMYGRANYDNESNMSDRYMRPHVKAHDYNPTTQQHALQKDKTSCGTCGEQ
jgi:hypothetical protein